ncbi:hypothetical protein [Myceligenerans salitolerans]|uniref:DUF4198 domain-containing protein n=1 Tax=Myceligenerans salitolerans TaxID=1230528 RepID=A0ABS3IC15_9MICO|nr:hypothetical protein [Myceligenerans salitolerans]MBO0609602.1 hypothetical protein [Myceligenerans salitolerans]
MTNADHPPEGEHPGAGSGLAAALEEMSRRGEAMAPPHVDAYAAVRGRVRTRRAAKAAGAGMMSVAAVTLVATGALYDPPHDMGYAPGVAGFTTAPDVLGLGRHGEAHLMLGFQPPGWEGSPIACGGRLPARFFPDEGEARSGDAAPVADGSSTGGYGLRITDVRRNTLAVTRTEESLSDDVLAGPLSFVWTQGGRVVSLPVDAVQDATVGIEDFTHYGTPSTRSACLGRDGADEDVSGPTAEAPELPAGTYEVRAYQYLVPTGEPGAVGRAVEDPSSWSAAVTVVLTEDGVLLPAG